MVAAGGAETVLYSFTVGRMEASLTGGSFAAREQATSMALR
jgi:hypothetical protein